MPLPAPEPGLVIRYDFVWHHDASAGRQQGKDRPACLVMTSEPSATPRYIVILPITHSPPTGDTVGVQIPPRLREALGLDEAPCWVIASEYNVDEWPNGGLTPLPGRPGIFAYGFIAPRLFARIKAEFLRLVESGRSTGTRR